MASLSQARALLRLIAHRPDALRAMVRWRPFSITSFEMARKIREQGIEPSTVIDGGANVGQFARAMLETFPRTSVYSFEPLPAVVKELSKNLQNEARAEIFQTALGSYDGESTFFAQPYTLASSVLKPVGDRTTEKIVVPVARIDSMASRLSLRTPVMLKLDLQGFELEALRGAEETLNMVRWVLLEVGFEPAYEDEATFQEIYDFLRDRGFLFRRPIDVLEERNGRITQIDALFERI